MPTQLPVEWVPNSLSPRLKRPVSEASDSPPSNAKSNKAWSYTSTFLCFHGTYRDNLTFYQKILFRLVICSLFSALSRKHLQTSTCCFVSAERLCKKWSLHRWKPPFFGVTVTKPQYCKFRPLRLTYFSELSHALWASFEMLMRLSKHFFCTLPFNLKFFIFIRLVYRYFTLLWGRFLLSSSTAHLWVLP